MMNWLLLRGLGRHSKHWYQFPDKLKEGLDKDGHILCLNLPGIEGEKVYYRSIKEITDHMRAQWLESKAQGPWSILAVSLGGMIALDWVSRYPEDFKNIVTINSSNRKSFNLLQRITPLAIKGIIKTGLKKDSREREREVLSMTTNLLLITDEVLDYWEKVSLEHPVDLKLFAAQLYAASKFKAPKSLEVPYTVITSKGDRFTSYKCSEDLAKKYKAPIFIHEKAGHDLPSDDPRWIIDILNNLNK